MLEIPEYKPTFFDRYGPDAGGYMRAFALGLGTFGTCLGVLLAETHASTLLGLLTVVIVSALLGSAAGGLTILLSNTAGAAYEHLMVNGSTTPYKEQYSYQQALVMQGKLDEALESFEAVIAENPEAIDPRIRAAELYARDKSNPVRAAALLREVQRIPAITTGEDIYAANRLIDLLNGPLNEPGRALVELRRLIEKYPGSAAADHARDALAALKPGHVPPAGGS